MSLADALPALVDGPRPGRRPMSRRACSTPAAVPPAAIRPLRRICRLARSLLRDLQQVERALPLVLVVRRRQPHGAHRRAGPDRAGATKATGSPRRSPWRRCRSTSGRLLWQQVWSRLDTLVCTSATLTVYGQGFDFFLGRVGLEPERLPPPLPPKTLVTHELPPRLRLPQPGAAHAARATCPPPATATCKRNFPVAVAELLRRFIPFFGGQDAGPVHRQLAARPRPRPPRRSAGRARAIAVLLPGAGQPAAAHRTTSATRNPVRCSARARSGKAWTCQGESLSYVFLEKLPYPSIGDPVEAARMNAVEAAGGNPFYGYLLPKMIILLKQGFGRLIRSADDRARPSCSTSGCAAPLYRTEVLRSLPDPTVGYESDVELFRRIAEWMGLPFDPKSCPRRPSPTGTASWPSTSFPRPFVSRGRLRAVAIRACWRCSRPSGDRTASAPARKRSSAIVLAGKDVLTLLPTGAGKSRTYQLPALIRPGLTLVISPLIALIRDQVEKLREVPGHDLSRRRWSRAWTPPARKRCCVPRPRAAEAALRLARTPARPALPRLSAPAAAGAAGRRRGPLHRHLGPRFPPRLPRHCPAAADRARRHNAARPRPDGDGYRQVQEEITDIPRDGTAWYRRARTVAHTGDFVRDNLVFRLYHVARREERDALAVGIVSQLVRNTVAGGAGIVYVATRKAATQLARLLRDRNIAAQAYHGGMPTPERHQVQERFMQGDLDVVVATTAFGMGVDKAEIRFVLHYDHPASLEAYVQEAGRAGRDGKEAYAILLYHKQTQRTSASSPARACPQPRCLAPTARPCTSDDQELPYGRTPG